MAEIFEKFAAYRPSKTVWFWSTAGMMLLTIILGFTWGVWVTPGSAAAKAKEAATSARLEFAANICAFRFLHADGADAKLAALKADESAYSRSSAIEDGGWVTFAGAKEPIDGAAELCADRLMKAEVQAQATPAAAATAATTPS